MEFLILCCSALASVPCNPGTRGGKDPIPEPVLWCWPGCWSSAITVELDEEGDLISRPQPRPRQGCFFPALVHHGPTRLHHDTFNDGSNSKMGGKSNAGSWCLSHSHTLPSKGAHEARNTRFSLIRYNHSTTLTVCTPAITVNIAVAAVAAARQVERMRTGRHAQW